jgi:hypothetical protein
MMSIIVHNDWVQIGTFSDGSPVLAVCLFEGDRMVGRVVNLNGSFRADFLNLEGEIEGIILPDYYTAVARVADEVRERQRRMH